MKRKWNHWYTARYAVQNFLIFFFLDSDYVVISLFLSTHFSFIAYKDDDVYTWLVRRAFISARYTNRHCSFDCYTVLLFNDKINNEPFFSSQNQPAINMKNFDRFAAAQTIKPIITMRNIPSCPWKKKITFTMIIALPSELKRYQVDAWLYSAYYPSDACSQKTIQFTFIIRHETLIVIWLGEMRTDGRCLRSYTCVGRLCKSKTALQTRIQSHFVL